jgi:hypothetical protein
MVRTVDQTACAEDFVGECYEAVFVNIGEGAGTASCRVRPRNGSDATFASGAKQVRFADVPPGGTFRLHVRVTENENGRFFVPSFGCSPGPRM